MSITLSAPPAVVQDVRMYAERHSTSLNAIIREHLEKIAALERKLRKERLCRRRIIQSKNDFSGIRQDSDVRRLFYRCRLFPFAGIL